MTSAEEKIVADVDTYGWHVINVLPEGDHPPHSFSIGLHRTFGHPEIVIVGLRRETAHAFINNTGEAIRTGAVFEAGGTYPELAVGHSVTFVEVPETQFREYLGFALWFYGEERFRVLQMVWPDREGNYPWQPDFDSDLRAVQPVLGSRA